MYYVLWHIFYDLGKFFTDTVLPVGNSQWLNELSQGSPKTSNDNKYVQPSELLSSFNFIKGFKSQRYLRG